MINTYFGRGEFMEASFGVTAIVGCCHRDKVAPGACGTRRLVVLV
jgi:hypothetical protein